MAMTANAYIAAERLGLFEQTLLASGWTAKNVGGEACFLPPEHLQAFSAAEYGAGHLHVWDAMNLQTRADLATVVASVAA